MLRGFLFTKRKLIPGFQPVTLIDSDTTSAQPTAGHTHDRLLVCSSRSLESSVPIARFIFRSASLVRSFSQSYELFMIINDQERHPSTRLLL